MRATTAKDIIQIPFSLAMLCFFTSCVSVNLGGGSAGKRAEGVHIVAPKSPFSKETRADLDGAWINSKSGNTISYLTDCQDNTDPSLDSIVQGAMTGLSDLKIDSTSNEMVQEREARRVVAVGKVDGVPSKIDLMVFRRNHCIYLLSYVGVQKAFEQDHAQFDEFIHGFRAP